MRRGIAILAVAAALLCGVIAGSARADSSNAGCQAYGAFVASAVQANVPGGAIVSGIARSGPGAVPTFAGSIKQVTCP
jgi:hypothetical protein